MILFENFEAVRFPEEEQLLVTCYGKLLYVYEYKYGFWRRDDNNHSITVKNYPEVTEDDLIHLTGGVLPKRELDFIRLCDPVFLSPWNMMEILEEDYPMYVYRKEHKGFGWRIGGKIYKMIDAFLEESCYRDKSYKKVRALLDMAVANHFTEWQVKSRIGRLSAQTLGRNVFNNEVPIFDERNHSYNFVGPERIIELPDKSGVEDVGCKGHYTISLDIDPYLYPFLARYFDNELPPNKWREKYCWEDDDGTKHFSYYEGFQDYCEANYYSLDAVERMLKDIEETAEALSTGRVTEYTEQLGRRNGLSSKETECIIDFYRRFILRMRFMLEICKEKGFNYIFVSGP